MSTEEAGQAAKDACRTPYHCRWERPIKEGEEVTWWESTASDAHDAALEFAKHCDGSNPRPPVNRVVVVALPGGGAKLIEVVVKPSLAYETNGM